MGKAVKSVLLRYSKPKRFLGDYRRLREGKLFLPSKRVPPPGTIISLVLGVPHLDNDFTLVGHVSTEDISGPPPKPGKPGVWVVFADACSDKLRDLEEALLQSPEYGEAVKNMPPLEKDAASLGAGPARSGEPAQCEMPEAAASGETIEPGEEWVPEDDDILEAGAPLAEGPEVEGQQASGPAPAAPPPPMDPPRRARPKTEPVKAALEQAPLEQAPPQPEQPGPKAPPPPAVKKAATKKASGKKAAPPAKPAGPADTGANISPAPADSADFVFTDKDDFFSDASAAGKAANNDAKTSIPPDAPPEFSPRNRPSAEPPEKAPETPPAEDTAMTGPGREANPPPLAEPVDPDEAEAPAASGEKDDGAAAPDTLGMSWEHEPPPPGGIADDDDVIEAEAADDADGPAGAPVLEFDLSSGAAASGEDRPAPAKPGGIDIDLSLDDDGGGPLFKAPAPPPRDEDSGLDNALDDLDEIMLTGPNKQDIAAPGDGGSPGGDLPEESGPGGKASEKLGREQSPAPDSSIDDLGLGDLLGEDESGDGGADPGPAAAASPGSGDSKADWVRLLLEAGEAEQETETPSEEPARLERYRSVQEKREITPEEREKLKPVAEFIINLVKSMLRSGYYDPDHPEAKQAKTGLYNQFKEVMADAPELGIANRETREETDFLVSGVLEDQASIRSVTGAGMAELFLPHLKEYFEKKGLVSFAIKREITEAHFEKFIDIMSDPKADKGENAKVGSMLTEQLIGEGINEISAVFMDDMIVLEESLPWRVEMAIQRLAKDIKVLPLLKGVSAEEIHRMKVRIVEDIIRPLRHPVLLKDIVLNCYIIARNVEDLDEKELEKTVVESFPLEMLLPTSRLVFDELTRLRERKKDHADNKAVRKRHSSVKRILRLIAGRVVMSETPGAVSFFADLFFNEILSFNELPPEVQYRVNTIKLADDVAAGVESYVKELGDAVVFEDAEALLQALRRACPVLAGRGEWEALARIAAGLSEAAADNPVYKGLKDGMDDPPGYALEGMEDVLAEAYMQADKDRFEALNNLTLALGPRGVSVLVKVLAESDSRIARKSAVEGLAAMGDTALGQVRGVLDQPKQEWFLYRNALLVLASIGDREEDFNRLRRFLRHPHPRVREEALGSVARLLGGESEPFLVSALDDQDPRVMRKALGLIPMVKPLSAESAKKIIEMLKAEPPRDRDQAREHDRRLAHLVRMIGTLDDVPIIAEVEDTVLNMAMERAKKKSSLLGRLKRSLDEDQDPIVLEAAVETLGKIGGDRSLHFLAHLVGDEDMVGRKAKQARDRLELRLAG